MHSNSRQCVTVLNQAALVGVWCDNNVRCKGDVFTTRAALKSCNAAWQDTASNALIVYAVAFLITWLLSVQKPSLWQLGFLQPPHLFYDTTWALKAWSSPSPTYFIIRELSLMGCPVPFIPLSPHSTMSHWTHWVVAAPGWCPVTWFTRGGGDRCLIQLRNLSVLGMQILPSKRVGWCVLEVLIVGFSELLAGLPPLWMTPVCSMILAWVHLEDLCSHGLCWVAMMVRICGGVYSSEIGQSWFPISWIAKMPPLVLGLNFTHDLKEVSQVWWHTPKKPSAFRK